MTNTPTEECAAFRLEQDEQKIHVSAVEEELAGDDLDEGTGVYSPRSEAHGAGE